MRGARLLPAAAAALALCGCEAGQEPAPAKTAQPAPPAAPPEPAGPPPPPYVGLWAARPELCPQGAWVFDRDKVVTAGEVACAFRAVNETRAGYQVMAECTAEGEAKAYHFTLTLTDPAPPRTMTVSRGPWDGPVTLIRCPG
jgi:hypothetical protein